MYLREYVTFTLCHRNSVCHLSSVRFVHPTQGVELFANISAPPNNAWIRIVCVKILEKIPKGFRVIVQVKWKWGYNKL